MQTVTLELPALYGDHHVIEVRRLLFELPGVEDIYASSTFHIVEVQFDEDQLSLAEIEEKLAAAGYQGDLPLPMESGAFQRKGEDGAFFRHTVAYAHTGQTVGFAQKVPYTGRPLWPCPGVGAIQKEEKIHG